MKQDSKKGDIKVFGTDLSKTSFRLHGVDNTGLFVKPFVKSNKNNARDKAMVKACLSGHYTWEEVGA